ncbi:MAG: hypothetical protein ACLPKT_22530 [Methylocella sp.]
MLELLLGLDILCESDIDRSRATYDAALPPGGGEPSLDEAIKLLIRRQLGNIRF